MTSSSTSDLITVIVTTYNRPAALDEAVHGLLRINRPDDSEIEIIIVDNASTDDTREVAAALSASVPPGFQIRYEYEIQQGVPFARNRGLEAARGDWIGFFDDDQFPDPRWLEELIEAAKLWDVRCVGGARTLKLETPVSVPEYCRNLLGEQLCDQAGRRFSPTFLPTTGNALVHRSVFKELGGFRNDFLEGGEDTEFFHRLVLNNIDARYTPAAVVQHIIPASRLNLAYYTRTARRHGIALAHRDFVHGGTPKVLWQACMRFVYLGLIQMRLLRARLFSPKDMATSQQDAATELLCRQVRTCGYLQFVTNRMFPGQGSLADLTHRVSSVKS